MFGVLTNCCIMGITSNQLSSHFAMYGTAGIVIALFLLEHGVLLFKYWLYTSISRVPTSITRAQQKDRKSIYKKRDRKKSNIAKSDVDSIWSPDFTESRFQMDDPIIGSPHFNPNLTPVNPKLPQFNPKL